MPKVSVILPIYNMELYLKECLDSIIKQTLKDIEIICINDGSTDNSLNILKEYAKADSRIKLVNQENQGQGTARNNGIKIAKGEYIAFVDPDDIIIPKMYADMFSAAKNNQVDVVYCDIEKFDNKKNNIGQSNLHKICKKNGIDLLPNSTFKFEDIKPICLMEMPNYPVNKIYKRDFIIKNNIFFGTQRRSQDKIFSLKVKVLSKNNYYIEKQYYKYRIYESSTSNARPVDAKSINDEIRAFCKQAGLMEDLEEQLNKFAGYMYAKECIMLSKEQKNDYKKYAKDNLLDEQYKIFTKYCNNFENSLDACENSKNTILQQIFSVKNDRRKEHKVITFLGIKLKIKISKEKKLKRQYEKIQKNYKNVLERLREKFKNNEKIKVVFLSDECQKWTYDSLYRRLEKSQYFEPQVVVYPLKRIHKGQDLHATTLQENYNFYKDRNINVAYAYENNNYLPITNFSPDIVFYMQPWMPASFKIQKVSAQALTMYCPYSFQGQDYEDDYGYTFHSLLFKYFVEHKLHINRFESYIKGASKNCISTGYPKLDIYKDLQKKEINMSKYWKEPDKFKIIYAPHHSISKNLHFATFLENGQFILDLAKKYQKETTWIFKPHPKLEYVLLTEEIMTEEEIKKYYEAWEKIGNKYELGDYFDIFQSSDLMITDCSSFLAEYLPSTHPIIRPLRKDMVQDNAAGKRLFSQYYETNNNDELEKVFKEIVINKNDYKKEERLKLIPEIIDFNKPASEKIYDYMLNILKGEDNE